MDVLCERPSNNKVAARANSRLPCKSNCICPEVESTGRYRVASIKPIRPMGILRRNITGQEKFCYQQTTQAGTSHITYTNNTSGNTQGFATFLSRNALETIPIPVAIIILAPIA